jgi:predicted enzyme related to lactoylglutathione lyase
MAEDIRGQFVWYELLTSDAHAAKKFYTEAIGWGTEEFKGGPGPYTVWTRSGKGFGGLMTLPDDAKKMGAPPHWLAYIGTPDVDATVADAKKRGAALLAGPMDIPSVGRFAVLRDPQGAVFAPFKPQPPPGSGGGMDKEAISWNELITSNQGQAFEFYSGLFGWKKTGEHDMGPMGKYLMYGQGERTYGGIMTKPPQIPVSHWMFYGHVSDVHGVAEKVKRLGGKIVNGPMEVPGGDLIAQFLDPQGAGFAIHGPKKG